jgi:hypothetical protein
MGPGVVLLLAIGGAALVRALGARQVRAGDRRFVPLTLFGAFLLAVLLIVVGLWAAARSLLLGIPVLAGALILGGGWLRVSLDQCRYAGPTRRVRDRNDVLIERLDAAYRSIAGWLLGSGFVAIVAVILWLLFGGRF